MTLIVMPDLVLWGTQWLRARLAERTEPVCRGVEVAHIEPAVSSAEFPKKLIVIGDDGNTGETLTTANASLRVSVLAGTLEQPAECVELARIVHAIMRDCARVEPGNPVAAVLASRGPLAVREVHPRARRLSTFDLLIVGEALP